MNTRSSVIQAVRGLVQCAYRVYGVRCTTEGDGSIGRGAVVAAGALVVSDVEPYSIVGGNPARSLGMRFTEAEIAAHEKGVLGRFSAAGPKATPSVQGVVDDS